MLDDSIYIVLSKDIITNELGSIRLGVSVYNKRRIQILGMVAFKVKIGKQKIYDDGFAVRVLPESSEYVSTDVIVPRNLDNDLFIYIRTEGLKIKHVEIERGYR